MLRIHDIIPVTRVNGPGKRYGIWFQGCYFNCPGCFNPETHDLNGGYLKNSEELFGEIISVPEIEGVSVSGGEPFLQAEKLLCLVRKLKKETKLTVLIFTGYELEELKKDNLRAKILNYTDIIITGKFQQNKPAISPLLGSVNQKIHFLTSAYSLKDLDSSDYEIIIDNSGNIIVSGVHP